MTASTDAVAAAVEAGVKIELEIAATQDECRAAGKRLADRLAAFRQRPNPDEMPSPAGLDEIERLGGVAIHLTLRLVELQRAHHAAVDAAVTLLRDTAHE